LVTVTLAAISARIAAIQLRHLRYFIKIVAAGSFSRAAALLYVAQPALSSQIAELEQELGIKLLHRGPRGVQPTPEGQLLYQEAQELVRQFDQLPEKIRANSPKVTGVVHLGVAAVLTQPLAGAFMTVCREALPDVTLSFASADSAVLRARVVEHELDLALVFEEEPLPGLSRTELFRQQMYVLHIDEALRNTASVRYADLAKRPLVSPGEVWRRSMEKRFAAAGVTPNIVANTEDLGSHLAAVNAGIGAIILPVSDPSSIPGAGNVIATPISDFHLTASLVWPHDAQLSRAGEAVSALLIPFIARYIKEKQPPGGESLATGDKR
jgi:LysR family transcriptional regulator, nitrogen assimilation regulatory protein